jgi:SNF2 family DNA or RNA helicase
VKRELMAAPGKFLRAALESDDDPTVQEQVEAVFVETRVYSDRVIGLGLWEPRDVPWLALGRTKWLEHESAEAPPARTVSDLTPTQAEDLRQRVADAIAKQEPVVVFRADDDAPDALPLLVPATPEMLDDLVRRSEGRPAPKPARPEVLVPIIETNEGRLGFQPDFTRRPALAPGLPDCLETPLKAHQASGLDWLQKSWLAGAPGVLLADDMGLGKTLQGLAFLAWLREAMQRGAIDGAPILIVAPTGLLANWSAEHARHLARDGLGNCLAAFGPGLRGLRGTGEGLDIARIEKADWVLTTYETLRDYSRDFISVRFAALLADEAQKVKTPGVRMTDALKAMQADFRIAMTGTPVENRLADLWCIVDGVRAGWLGDLRTFSQTYEAAADLDALKGLKQRLDEPFGGAPALLLRRMKEDHLPDLPRANPVVARQAMPEIQQRAYLAALAEARTGKTRGAVLKALQAFRAISLHPTPAMEVDDATFIAASARLALAFAALDVIARAGERVLVFLEKQDMQPRIAGMIQRRYGLDATPEIINGAVPGARRQARVDRFQTAPEGFDAMILAPRAAGVGLTITRANHVIHLDRWWNPAVEDQCTGRVLRIGQTRTVHIHVPIATLGGAGRSFDENLHAMLERKRTMMREALLPPEPDDADADALFGATVGGVPG